MRPSIDRPRWLVRLAAVLIAALAWTGLALDFAASLHRWGSVIPAVWSMLRFFTVITNLVVGIAFTGIAAGRQGFARPRFMAGLSLSILLVGVVFKLLLEGLFNQGTGLSNLLLHRATPILVPLFWLAFVPKGSLRLADPLAWIVYPLAYLAYVLARGALGGMYPYPFLDVGVIGWSRMAINALVIGLGFIATGFVWVWLDRMLGHRHRTTTKANA